MKKVYIARLTATFTPFHYSFFRNRKIVGNETTKQSDELFYVLVADEDEVAEKIKGIKTEWNVLQGMRLHNQYENLTIKATYEEATWVSLQRLAKSLPADDFLEYCKDRGLMVALPVPKGGE